MKLEIKVGFGNKIIILHYLTTTPPPHTPPHITGCGIGGGSLNTTRCQDCSSGHVRMNGNSRRRRRRSNVN
ncbi:MAG: hypothetical protein MJA29_03785, partial [Candidatus Omnitrophica bacterium]|nr:hypothetical protein [Candidatus Omnitrophota bacterium]